MAYEVEGDTLLDLSFLTEEEQDAITSVLSRDARLRQLEEGRVSKLRASLVDPGQLKTLTGDWFRDARSQRHRHARLGSDLVRASIRRKKRSRGEETLLQGPKAPRSFHLEPYPTVSEQCQAGSRHLGPQLVGLGAPAMYP